MNAREDDTRGSRPRRRRTAVVEIAIALLLAPALVWLAVYAATGESGLLRVADDQVAVVLDRWSGARRVSTVPGYVVHAPWIQEVTLLPRSPRSLVIGKAAAAPPGGTQDGVPRLLARAGDGSTFWFESIELQYALRPEAAATRLDDTGPDEALARELLLTHARSILRDELGRIPSEEIARGESVQEVVRSAQARLNAALAAHGIEVIGISASQPGFDKAYEDAIARRKTFEQEAEGLQERIARLDKDRQQREAQVRKEKEIELAKLEGDLVRDRGAAVKDDRKVRQEADDFFREQRKVGEAAKLEKQAQAGIVKARHVAAARAVYRDGLEIQLAGDLAVREALVQKLAGIEIDVVPVRPESALERERPEGAPQTAKAKK